MSANQPNNIDNQEIDLGQLSKKVGEFFGGISMYIFQWILFFKKNILTIGILFVIGVALGFYLDKTTQDYDHQIIVTPNFGSSDFLYTKIDLLNSKINEGDTVYLKNFGFKDTKKLKFIEIEPIIDVYKFIDNSAENFELIKLMAEDGDLNKIVKDRLTSKNYPYHLVKIKTSKKILDQEIIKPLMSFLNNSEYYKVIQKEFLNNTNTKIRENDSIIKQINGFLDNFKKSGNNGAKNSSLVYYNDNMQLNEIIKTKDALINEQGSHRLQIVNYDKIIKDISITTNIKNNNGTNGKMKLVLPFLFIFLFLILTIFMEYYKKQMSKLNS